MTIVSSFLTLVGTCLAVYFSYRGLTKQLKNSPQTAKEYLPILLEALENLDVLKTACIHNGKYCPVIEHRMPTFAAKDGVADFSYAQRSQQFRSIGRKLVKNCREICIPVT